MKSWLGYKCNLDFVIFVKAAREWISQCQAPFWVWTFSRRRSRCCKSYRGISHLHGAPHKLQTGENWRGARSCWQRRTAPPLASKTRADVSRNTTVQLLDLRALNTSFCPVLVLETCVLSQRWLVFCQDAWPGPSLPPLSSPPEAPSAGNDCPSLKTPTMQKTKTKNTLLPSTDFQPNTEANV